ncbi:MAG: tetratricopeptide (TPR) repeat protein, partial [Flavobacteriales bacterium]
MVRRTQVPVTKHQPMKRIASLFTLGLAFTLSVSVVAQDNSKYGDTEEQQLECMESLSVYKSFKKQKNYNDAYPGWQKACAVCPEKVTEGLYIDGARFIKDQMKKTKDEARKIVLFDSLLHNYDKRMDLFPTTNKKPNNRAYIMGFKADDYNRYVGDEVVDAKVKAFEMYKESLEGMKEKAAASTFSGYYISLFYAWKQAEGEAQTKYSEDLYTDYLMLQDYIDLKIKSNTSEEEEEEDASSEKEVERLIKARNNIDEVFVTIAECESMIPVLEAKVAASPDDFEVKKKALRLMNKKECNDTSFYLEMAQAVDAQEPNESSKFSIGILLAKESKYSESLKYLEQAVEMCGDCPDLETYLLKAGQVASVMNQSAKARGYAGKLLKLNPKSGEAYLLHGDAISSSTVSDRVNGRSKYWLATDYYNRAKNVDGTLSVRANKKISNCKQQYPTKEDIFTEGLKEGTSYT